MSIRCSCGCGGDVHGEGRGANGHSEVVVFWLEVVEGEEELLLCDQRFSSLEESMAFLKEKIAEGTVYDYVGHIETYLGAEWGPRNEQVEKELRGISDGQT